MQCKMWRILAIALSIATVDGKVCDNYRQLVENRAFQASVVLSELGMVDETCMGLRVLVCVH